MQKNVPRHVAWRLSYERNRYLQHQPNDVLFERLRYLIENITTLTPDGRVGVDGFDPLAEGLWVAFTHTQYEMDMRGLTPPDGFLKEARIAQPTFPSPAPGGSAYSSPNNPAKNGQLFKFGKRVHLEQLLNEGTLRLGAASSFTDPSLSIAAQDDEIRKTIFPSTGGIGVTLPSGKMLTGGELKNFSMTFDQGTDYYVWCVSSRYAHRMYADFSADSCLVIYNYKLFWERLHQAIEQQLRDWTIVSSPVSYVDPYNPPSGKMFVAMAKHHRYTYQRELRTIALPPASETALAPLNVVIDLAGLKLELLNASDG